MKKKKELLKKRHKIIMTIEEARNRLATIKNSNLRKELEIYPPDYWLVEGDEPKKNGQPQFFIMENCPENNIALSGTLLLI